MPENEPLAQLVPQSEGEHGDFDAAVYAQRRRVLASLEKIGISSVPDLTSRLERLETREEKETLLLEVLLRAYKDGRRDLAEPPENDPDAMRDLGVMENYDPKLAGLDYDAAGEGSEDGSV